MLLLLLTLILMKMLLPVTLAERHVVVEDDALRLRVVTALLQQAVCCLTSCAQLATPGEHSTHHYIA